MNRPRRLRWAPSPHALTSFLTTYYWRIDEVNGVGTTTGTE